jgi:galactose mutarotase-like enzyme
MGDLHMQVIENEFLRVSVDEVGALLTSVIAKDRGQELLWQKDPAFWPNQDVVIFPIIGFPEYDYEGKHYVIKTRHGFARAQLFSVKEKKADSVTLLLLDNPETREVYPFAFALEVTLSLKKHTLERKVKVINKSANPLPFALGLHQAFRAKFDGSASIEFNKAPSSYYPMREGLFKAPSKSIYAQREVLKKDLWSVNETWALPNDQHYEISVKTGFGYRLKFHFEAPEIAIWSKEAGGDFLCVEPWWGFSAYEGMPKEISERRDENVIKDNKTFVLDIEISAI